MNEPGDWLGRRYARDDFVTERLVEEFRATLAANLFDLPVPSGLHWCLAPDIAVPDRLGRDGHPSPGIFLPDTGLPRRMWAGGELTIHRDFTIGDVVRRDTEIAAIDTKAGRTGRLCFVQVNHAYAVEDGPIVSERHDIVYREEPQAGRTPPPSPATAWQTTAEFAVTPTPTLLFRYSALTFNGHRIHYDIEYARSVEGYEGLVVHGPLQATWMLNQARALMPDLPMRFTYRALNPLICGIPVTVEARWHDNQLELRVRRQIDNVVTMQATATAAS